MAASPPHGRDLLYIGAVPGMLLPRTGDGAPPSGSVLAVIDLRSDTLTQPTPGMRRAIAEAEVGDEQKREDPTVNELERRAAPLLGQEEAVFVPTATMANQIALRILTAPGDAMVAEQHSHVLLSELGGPAVHSGLLTLGIVGATGRFTPEQVVEQIRDRTSMHVAPTRLRGGQDTPNNAR